MRDLDVVYAVVYASVGNRGIYAEDRTYMIPSSALDFMERFDAGRPVSPFTFIATRVA